METRRIALIVTLVVAALVLYFAVDSVWFALASGWASLITWANTRETAKAVDQAARQSRVELTKPRPDPLRVAADSVDEVPLAQLLAEENEALREKEGRW